MSYKNMQEIVLIERVMKLFAWALLITGMVMTWNYGNKFFDTASKIDIEIAKKYEVSVAAARSLTCYKGYLHYPNAGAFSGLMAISPSQECDASILKHQTHNEYSIMFLLSGFLVVMSLLFVYLFSRTDDGESTSR